MAKISDLYAQGFKKVKLPTWEGDYVELTPDPRNSEYMTVWGKLHSPMSQAGLSEPIEVGLWEIDSPDWEGVD